MAKPSGVSLADLIAGQQKNDVQMSNYVRQQLDTQLKTEQILKDTQVVQAATATETALSKQDEDKIRVDINKGLLAKTGEGLNSNIIKMAKDIKKLTKLTEDQSKKVLDKSKEAKEFKSIGQRIGGVKEGVKDFFTMRGFLDKTGIVKRGTGGIVSNMLDSREQVRKAAEARLATGERARDPATGKIMGAEGSRKVFRQEAKEEQKLRRTQGDLERKVTGYKEAGLNERQISQTKEGKALEKLAEQFIKLNPMKYASDVDEKGNPVFERKNKEDEKAEREPKTKVQSSDISENELENLRIQEQQHDLLVKIEENTRPGEAAGKGGGEGEGEGGGILSGIGKGLTGLGKGLGNLGKGLGKGIEGILKGLAAGLRAIANPIVLIGLAALTIALIGIGKALQLAAPFMEAFAPVLMKVVEVIGTVFIEAIKAIPGIITSIGDVIVNIIKAISEGIVNTINAVTDSIERLSKIDGKNLLAVGAGLFAVASGMAAFAAANVVSGIGNLATGLLSAVSGQKTPVEQMEQIAKLGPNLNQAGTGMKNLADGLTKFASIDGEKLKVISALPVDKIKAMGIAMGSANAVYNQSAQNKDMTVALTSAKSEPSTIVAAPTQVNNQTQNAMFKNKVRNDDHTVNSYLKTRFV